MADATVQAWFSTAEAARMLGISPEALRKLVQRGRIRPDSTQFKSYRFKMATIEAFAKGKRAA